MARKVTLLGRTNLDRKLKALPLEIKKQIRAAIEQGAREIVALAQSLAPVSEPPGSHGNPPGTLRDSIGWTWGRNIPEGATVLARTTQTLGSEFSATIFAGSDKAFYARWREFGTPNLPAQPYFFPAYRANKKTVKARIRRAVRDAARQQAKA